MTDIMDVGTYQASNLMKVKTAISREYLIAVNHIVKT